MKGNVIKEEYYFAIPYSKRRYNRINDSSINWIRIGEYYNKEWSNSAMKYLTTIYFIEVNENTFGELEELKEKSISRYLMAIRATQEGLNVLHNNVIRFIDENGSEKGVTSFGIENVKLYDEYKNSVWGDVLNDYVPKKEDYHKEFMNNLMKNGNNIVLRHNSSYRITDGIVLSTAQRANRYTPQSDIGCTYFWASKHDGNDISGGEFTYYCEVPLDYVYDYSSNLEGFKSQSEALSNYPYIACYWHDEDAIVVKTQRATPISYIRYKDETYDSEWNRL